MAHIFFAGPRLEAHRSKFLQKALASLLSTPGSPTASNKLLLLHCRVQPPAKVVYHHQLPFIEVGAGGPSLLVVLSSAPPGSVAIPLLTPVLQFALLGSRSMSHYVSLSLILN